MSTSKKDETFILAIVSEDDELIFVQLLSVNNNSILINHKRFQVLF